jgi:DNA-binding NarL/FixJ family response regulator
MGLDPVHDSSGDDDISPVRYTRCKSKILRLIAAGLSNAEIAEKLQISRYTVAQHIAEMFRITGARSRAELVARAYCDGILSTRSWPPGLNDHKACSDRILSSQPRPERSPG